MTMLDLNIPWPTQTFADAQRAGIVLRQQQQQAQGGGTGASKAGGDALALDSGDQAPLSKKARKKLQKQQQQQQQQQAAAASPAPASTANASTPSAAAPSTSGALLPEWNALDDLPAPDRLRLRLLAVSLASLGYKTCAFNHTLAQPTRFDPARHANPFSPAHSAASMPAGTAVLIGKGKTQVGASGGPPRRAVAPVPFPELDPRFRGSSSTHSGAKSKGKQRADGGRALGANLSLDPSLLDPGSSGVVQSLRIVQLHRLTLPLDDSSCSSAAGQGHGLVASAAPALQSYDVLAVHPTTEAAFSLACLSLAELKPFGIDIISLDLGAQPRLPFWVKRSLVRTALQLGVVFEVAYAGALPGASAAAAASSSNAAEAARRNLISSTRALLMLTKGTNIIISSGARDAMQLRAPLDVINLFGAILGMGEGAARQAVSQGPEAVIRRARARKEVWRGIVGEARVRQEPVRLHAPTGELTGQGSADGWNKIGTGDIVSEGVSAGLGAGVSGKEESVKGLQPRKEERKNKRKRDSVDAG
ncbi:RNA-binding RNA processing protein rpp1 [Tilletia horrida]|nr:RNA-binding RNA processing protein rpp1 [Tilletia horrida]